jgi:hypothetical protein
MSNNFEFEVLSPFNSTSVNISSADFFKVTNKNVFYEVSYSSSPSEYEKRVKHSSDKVIGCRFGLDDGIRRLSATDGSRPWSILFRYI